MAGIIGLVVRGVASGIGLASEAHTAHKNKKKARLEQVPLELPTEQINERSQPSPNDLENALHTEISELDASTDEAYWQLDDAQDEIAERDAKSPSPLSSPPSYGFSVEPDAPVTHTNKDEPSGDAEPTNIASQVPFFLSRYKPPSPSVQFEPLPFPVVLPQRRPKDRTRGFIHAYAPVLAEHDITETTFIDFIETFDRASQASPWIRTVNLATVFSSLIPEGVNIAVSAAIRMAVKAAIEMQARQRTNSFLDEINQGFFQPRGLYALIMTWRPNSYKITEPVSLDNKVRRASHTPSGTLSRIQHSLRSSTATTFELPETAELIYPELDKLALSGSTEATGMKANLASHKDFVMDYMDRRAQAEYQRTNPRGMLARGPKPSFTSRYADPSSSAASGDLAALVTGGKVNLTAMKRRAAHKRVESEGFGTRRPDNRATGDTASPSRIPLDDSDDAHHRRRSGPLAGAIGGAKGLVSGVRGGVLNGGRGTSPGSQSLDSAYGRQGWLGPKSQNAQESGRANRSRRGPGAVGLAGLGSLKKVLQQDILYLLIVNMPTKEELVEAGPVELPAS